MFRNRALFASSIAVTTAAAAALALSAGCKQSSSSSSDAATVAAPQPAPSANSGGSGRKQSAKANAPDIGSVYVSAAPYRNFQFGPTKQKPGKPDFVRIGPDMKFGAASLQGWLDNAAAARMAGRDRVVPDALRRTFVYGKGPATFRVAALPPGLYRLTLISGDSSFADHETEVAVSGATALPRLKPGSGEFTTLTCTVAVEKDSDGLDITFRSPVQNWVVNSLTLAPIHKVEATRVTLQKPGGAVKTVVTAAPSVRPEVARAVTADAATAAQTKAAVAATPQKPSPPLSGPVGALWERFRTVAARPRAAGATAFMPTGLSRESYLKIIAGEVDFWKTKQARDGAIIDPYRKAEVQYSTPAFACAAAALVTYAGRQDLTEPAAKAMDKAVTALSSHRAADHHEDFYAPMLAHALRLLKPHVTPARAADWEEKIRSIDPKHIYRAPPGGNNWNVVAMAGEGMFQMMGLRPKTDPFVTLSMARQEHKLAASYGLYTEGPMAYDHFPRAWAADLLAQGYDGPGAQKFADSLRRAAMTSLFLQSPWGELPAGGRSGQHQWNEAEQCVTFEIYATEAQKAGDLDLAAVYKRAAHLSLASMKRWVRPSGEMQIVKNHIDPAQEYGYEHYSSHSQYNLMPMALLAMAYEHAGATESVSEKPAPADLGGYVLDLAPLHKVFANVAGTYVEIEPRGDQHYDATGLIRIQCAGLSPQLGPSDSLLPRPAYDIPSSRAAHQATAIGIAWRDAGGTGAWHQLAEMDRSHLSSTQVAIRTQAPDRVAFDVVYQGQLFGVNKIVEHYTVSAGRVELATEIPGYKGPVRYVWPILADDGATKSDIRVNAGVVTASQDGGKTAQTFTSVGAASVTVGPETYANRNGWMRLGVAEYPSGANRTTFLVAPKFGALAQGSSQTGAKATIQQWAKSTKGRP